MLLQRNVAKLEVGLIRLAMVFFFSFILGLFGPKNEPRTELCPAFDDFAPPPLVLSERPWPLDLPLAASDSPSALAERAPCDSSARASAEPPLSLM